MLALKTMAVWSDLGVDGDDKIQSNVSDSSLEKVTSSPVGERRGSLPLVGAADDDNIMESSTSSTTSRLAVRVARALHACSCSRV